MLRHLLKGLVDIVYPKTCVLCKKILKNSSSIDNLVCMECWRKIKKNRPPFCRRCGRTLKPRNFAKNICSVCIKRALHFDRAFSPCVYDGAIKELIHQFKYKNKDYLGNTLSKLMVDFIKEFNLPMERMDYVMPVPLHKVKLREREFNQAQILSNQIAYAFGKTALNDILERPRNTKTQTELEENERFLNVKGSFSLSRKKDIEGKNILLIDDVLTTGATTSEAALTLKQAGAHIVFVLTLAN